MKKSNASRLKQITHTISYIRHAIAPCELQYKKKAHSVNSYPIEHHCYWNKYKTKKTPNLHISRQEEGYYNYLILTKFKKGIVAYGDYLRIFILVIELLNCNWI